MKRELIFTTIAAEIVWFFVIWYSEVNMWIDQWLVIGLALNLFWIGTLFTVISIPLFAKRAVTPRHSVTLETGHPFSESDPIYYQDKGEEKVMIYPKYKLFAGGGAYLSNVYGWKGGGREGGIWIVPNHLADELNGNWRWNCDFDKYVGEDHKKLPIHLYDGIIKHRSNFDDKIPIYLGREEAYDERKKERPEINWRMRENFLNDEIHELNGYNTRLKTELRTTMRRYREREGGQPRSIVDKMLKDKGERFGE
jgi:hypothetical protein